MTLTSRASVLPGAAQRRLLHQWLMLTLPQAVEDRRVRMISNHVEQARSLLGADLLW